MWNQRILELFITIIPQSFALILLFFSLVGIKIEKKSFILFSVGISFIPFLLRPYVDFGVHSILTIFALVLISIIWAKANVISSILFSIVSFGVAYMCEWLTFIFLEIIHFNMQLLDTDIQLRTMLGFIPLLALFAVGLAVYFIKKNIKKKEEIKNDVV